MILAVLDDLMFTSKIKTAAAQLGVTVTFARSAENALVQMQSAAPSLVIIDLNNARVHTDGGLRVAREHGPHRRRAQRRRGRSAAALRVHDAPRRNPQSTGVNAPPRR
jgi:ActR/RegA family two-component response regulator